MYRKQHPSQVRPSVTRSSFSSLISTACRAMSLGAVAMAICAPSSAADVPQSLEQATARALAGASEAAETGLAEKEVRLKAMREAAQSYGARAGLMHRTHEIRGELDRAGKYLDVIWNFQPMMLSNTADKSGKKLQARDILPPIIGAEDASFKQDSETIIHKGGPNYHILSQARFVSAPPTWRNYLYTAVGEDSPVAPPSALKPRTEAEQREFARWVREGWAAGEDQANKIYTASLNKMDRDFLGTVTYHELLRDKVVSLPFVASSNPGVSGDANNLNINDVTLNITVMPQFRLDSAKWSPGGND
jgi:defect-in-organelle-trafficking protein DotC